MSNNLKLLPILILVAMLAFSVRLVETVTGVSTLSGSAVAQEDMSKSIAEQIAERQAKPMEKMDEEDKPEAKEEMMAIAESKSEEFEWRDAADQEVGVKSVKMELFDDLTKRRKALDQRAKELMTREALLRAAEQELDRKFQELTGLRREIEELLTQQSEEEKARIASLVKIYEGMKPKDAARIFDTLDLDVLVSVMAQMSERRLAPVLAAMNPERARTITIMLAEEKKLPELPVVE